MQLHRLDIQNKTLGISDSPFLNYFEISHLSPSLLLHTYSFHRVFFFLLTEEQRPTSIPSLTLIFPDLAVDLLNSCFSPQTVSQASLLKISQQHPKYHGTGSSHCPVLSRVQDPHNSSNDEHKSSELYSIKSCCGLPENHKLTINTHLFTDLVYFFLLGFKIKVKIKFSISFS